MTNEINKDGLDCVIFVLLILLLGTLSFWFNYNDNPQPKYTPPVVVESPKPKVKIKEVMKPMTADQWEKLNMKLLMDDYHLDYFRRDIIKDFITTNKDKVEQAIKEMRE